MNPGILNRTITFQNQSTTSDSYGQQVNTWTDYLKTRAGIEPLRGREFLQGIAAQSEITHIVRMRYKTGIVPTMRIKYCDRYFEISYVLNLMEKNRELEIYCTEVYNAVM
jgi:SPP1 family predicted phage head-tail adaptor